MTGTSHQVGVPPGGAPGTSRMSCHHRAVHVACLPPTLLSPGVHVPSSLPSLRSVSAVAFSTRPLLTNHTF